jgi:cytoskeletal protein CcmA (bactofilin family)
LVYINGLVEGDISVFQLCLGPQAVIKGNILCRELEMVNGAQLSGMLNISPQAEIPTEMTNDLVFEEPI